MNRIRSRIIQFMHGRNGVDALGAALMALYLVIYATNSFIRSMYLAIPGYLLPALVVYRILSRDLARRRRENNSFMRLYKPCKAFCLRTARRFKDIRTHRYRVCPQCKVSLRLPIQRGRHSVVCPRCAHRLAVRVWI